MKRMEPAAIYAAHDLSLPLPVGYRIEKNGAVTRTQEFDDGDTYLQTLFLIAALREQSAEITRIRRWDTFLGIVTVISIIIIFFALISR